MRENGGFTGFTFGADQIERCLRAQAAMLTAMTELSRAWAVESSDTAKAAGDAFRRMTECREPAQAVAIWTAFMDAETKRLLESSRQANERWMTVLRSVAGEAAGNGASPQAGGDGVAAPAAAVREHRAAAE